MADLAGTVADAMAQLTAAQATLMVDACTVTRPADPGQTPDLDADGNVVPADGAVVYAGRCSVSDPRVPPRRGGIIPTDADGSPEQRTLRVPHAAALATGDQVEITACAFSSGMVGDLFAVVREDERSYATFRSYILRGSSWQPLS